MTKPSKNDPASFADVIANIKKDEDLAATKRRDCVSALNSLARMLGLEPTQVPANTDWLRQRLSSFHPKHAGIGDKRYANIRSAVMFSLRHSGASNTRAGWLPPMTSAWNHLFMLASSNKEHYKLSRLFRWCSAEGIASEDLTNSHIDRFEAILVAETLTKDPHKAVRTAVNMWNRCAKEIDGWPAVTLTPRRKREPWTIPLDMFPESFQMDVDAWFKRCASEDIFDDDAPTRAMRPTTIKHRKLQVRMAASALVHSGVPILNVTSLSALVDINAYKRLLQNILDRAGGETTEAIFGLASGLKAIAIYHVKVCPDHAAALKHVCSKLGRSADRTRPTKKRRMSQFDDPRALQILLNLPSHLAGLSPGQGAKPRTGPLIMQVAVALELLFFTALRINNISQLDMERHFRWKGSGRRLRLDISIPGHEVKNGRPLNFELVGTSAQMVRDYIDDARGQLTKDITSTAVFPKQNGTPKNPNDLSFLIKSTIFKHTGLDVTPHLIRSLVARIHNQVAVGDYGTVAHVLGDRIGTVMKSYANFEQQAALRVYQHSVLKVREWQGGAA